MSEEKKEEIQKEKKQEHSRPRMKEKDIGLNLDKMEYEQIVLSQSNFPDRDYYRRNYGD